VSVSDLAFAHFIGKCETTPWKAMSERFKPSRETLAVAEYDRVTDYNLAFIRGQQVAEQNNERRTAA
jgi:hypothetical protein